MFLITHNKTSFDLTKLHRIKYDDRTQMYDVYDEHDTRLIRLDKDGHKLLLSIMAHGHMQASLVEAEDLASHSAFPFYMFEKDETDGSQ